MPSLGQRMRKLQTRLLDIRLGPGAVALPKEVKRIHLRFAPKFNEGHMGPRRFWRSELIRLKYHNPAVSMTVDRTVLQSEQATMSIHFASPEARQTSESATSSPAPVASTTLDTKPGDHDPTERVETINMKHRTNSEILNELIRVTNAYPIEPTAEEREELQILEQQRLRSLEDSKRSQEVRARVKRENELLEQARGDMAAPEAA